MDGLFEVRLTHEELSLVQSVYKIGSATSVDLKSTQAQLAIAVLRGDQVAARALADWVCEEWVGGGRQCSREEMREWIADAIKGGMERELRRRGHKLLDQDCTTCDGLGGEMVKPEYERAYWLTCRTCRGVGLREGEVDRG